MVDLRVVGSLGVVAILLSATLVAVVVKGKERLDKYSGHGTLNKLLWKSNPV